MITLTKLRRKPRHFQKFTGLTLSEFDQILAEVTQAYQQAEQERSACPERLRKAGAGRPFALPLSDRLLMGLIYLRLYCSYSLLSYLFDLDASNICREFNDRLMPVLLQVLPIPLRDAPLRYLADEAKETSDSPKPPRQKRPRITTLEELLKAHPEFEELLVDATEQELPQPEDKLKRKLAYSGKQHTHTLKTQIVATKELVLHVFGGLPGSLHDMTVLRASGVMHQIPVGVKVRQDKGYEGSESAYPLVAVQMPIKKKPQQQVTAFGKAYNHLLSVLRMPVEHHFARLQKFGCLAGLWRGPHQAQEDFFCIVSGLLNFRATGRFELA